MKNEPILLIDGHCGIYIPKIFCERFNPEKSLWQWNYQELREELSTPENEFYWDAWCEVLDTAAMTLNGVTYRLHQEDDLWAYPEGYEQESED